MNLLEDEVNLQLLRYLVSGEGIHVNINAIAKEFNIHRNTAKKKIQWLYDQKILNPPFYSFPYLYTQWPILVLVKADIPRSNEINEFYVDDGHIFAAFSCMEGPYNTLLIEFFENLESYHSWRERIVIEEKIPNREYRAPAHAYIFSNKLTFKNDPNCFIRSLKRSYQNQGHVMLNKCKLDETIFPIFEQLMLGNFIQRNDTYISSELGLNRKTIKHHIDRLIENQIIEEPRCFFPNLFVPPEYNLIVSMLEITSHNEKVKEYILNHDNIPRAQDTSTGCYNLLLFSAFHTIEGFFDLGEELLNMFAQDIGAISNIILSSRMIHTIKPQKLSLGWIDRKLWDIKHK